MRCVRRLRNGHSLFTFPLRLMTSGIPHAPPHASHSQHVSYRHPSHSRVRHPSHTNPFQSHRQADLTADTFLGPLEFDAVWPLQIDANAAAQLEQYLKHEQKTPGDSFPAIHVMNVPKSTLKRALMRFAVRGRAVVAIGQSTRTKLARTLCCMHALRLVDHHSVDAVAPAPREPLPLEEARAPRARAVARPARRGPPSAQACGDWAAYVRDCEAFVRDAAQARREEAYAQLRIPPSGHPIVDRAAALAERGRAVDPAALQRLSREAAGAAAAMRVERVGARVFAATLALDGAGRLTATGVAATAKDAKRRCAAHALAILQLARKCDEEGRSGGSGIRSVSADAMAASLPPRRARQLQFFLRLCGAVPAASFTREAQRVACRLELEGVSVRAEGATRFEAERRALEDALAELELHDERLQAINSLMARHPGINPQHMPTARLSAELRAAVHDAVERGAAANARGAEAHNVNTGEAVDRETMTTIAAMESAVTPDPSYAARMRDRLTALRADPRYLSRFHPRRSSLAIASVSQRILDALEHHRVVVVSGTTGCGKTTQVPQFILDQEIMAGRGDRCCIVLTQPRRLSALSVADRIASERLSGVGEDIGYAVRLDAKPGRHLTLCTTGVLLQMLASMPTLSAVTHLIIDEVHERDINCDVVLALARQLISGPNKDLKVILMSATMQSDTFAAYFGGVPVISVDGANYPVSVRYLADIAKLMQARGQYSSMFDALGPKGKALYSRHRRNQEETRAPKTDYTLLAHLVEHSVAVDMCGDATGKSVLVFLPGWKEMQAARRAIETIGGTQRYHIILLHSTVDAAKQRECFAPPPSGRVKIILATNIAESGITIDDAVVVIDTGLIKQTAWVLGGGGGEPTGVDSQCHVTYATQLALTFASRANCTQRKGRAGRTQAGVCYRLFTRDVWESLPAFQRAEIHRTPLTQVILKLLSLGYTSPRETLQTFMEPPAERNVQVSIRQLQSLGAVTADEKLTPLGLYLSRLPCEPHVGKMLMTGAVLHCLDSALTMVATGSISPFITSRDLTFEVRERRYALAVGSESDHISAINAYNAFSARRGDETFAYENYLNFSNMRLISRYKQQYCDILRRSGFLRAGETLRRVESGLSTCSDNSNGASGDDDDVLYMDTNSQNDLYVDAGPLSSDSTDVALVKACLCSALFPNVAVADPESMLQAKPTKRLVMRTAMRSSISPSKDSSCRRLRRPVPRGPTAKVSLLDDMNSPPMTPSMLYMYESVFCMKETREEFLTQVSSVSLWAFLLFGVTEADTTFDRELGFCVVGRWIGIQIDTESFDALQALRAGLHACVLRKYTRPTDEANNKTLEELRHLCKAVLKSPPSDGEQYFNRLVDAGRILSPVVPEPLTEDSSDKGNGEEEDDALDSLQSVS